MDSSKFSNTIPTVFCVQRFSQDTVTEKNMMSLFSMLQTKIALQVFHAGCARAKAENVLSGAAHMYAVSFIAWDF